MKDAVRNQIRLLPVQVANKIAAGEVVERPASVVKELIENAIDAGATRIDVVISAGGRKLISISDNGCGMDRDNALLCLEPQATSKIRDVDDIERIDTYGFRGEAIPSIAAVSRFTVRTCAQGENCGTCIEVAGGQIQSVTDIGFPAGTTFEVRDLFFNVPARRKFLKTFQTEQTHIRTVFILQALAHPEIAFRLKTDGYETDTLPGGSTLAERITGLFKSEFMSCLREVNYTNGGIRISGYVGIPTFNRADRSEQYIFVNRRAATAPVIPYALREAYPSLEGERKPIVVLFIDLPPTEVDVNVHPTKREVRFRDASAVRQAIITAVTRALGIAEKPTAPDQQPPSPFTRDNPNGPFSRSYIPPAPVLGANREPTSNLKPQTSTLEGIRGQAIGNSNDSTSTLNPQLSNHEPAVACPVPSGASHEEQPQISNPDPRPQNLEPRTQNLEPSPSPPAVQQPLIQTENSPWSWCRVLGQITDGYIIIETNDGFAVVDPQAAHERVVFERLMDEMSKAAPVSQQLLIPESVRLPPEDAKRIRDNMEMLRAMGFGIDTFGQDGHFIIDALPSVIDSGDCRRLLADISSAIEMSGVRRGTARWREETVASAAAKASVPRVAKLAPEAMAKLVHDLAGTALPYTSPRGRPTMLFTSLKDLARKFVRN